MMDIGQAIAEAKDGRRIARTGWNGKDQFVYYVPGGNYKAQTPAARGEFGEYVPYDPYLALKNAQGTVSTWAPSCNDALAEDWIVLL